MRPLCSEESRCARFWRTRFSGITQRFAPERRELHDAGLYRFRQTGERHSNSPGTRAADASLYQGADARGLPRHIAELVETREPVAIRDLLDIAPGSPIPLDEVQSEAEILARFSHAGDVARRAWVRRRIARSRLR